MSGRTFHRYPFDPIRRMFDYRNDVNGFVSDEELARCLGTTRNAVIGWRRNGVSELVADKLAVTCGTLPYVIWPEWLEHGVERADRRAAQKRRRTQLQAERRRAART